MPEPSQIEQKILSTIRASELSDDGFNALALDVFAHQYAHNLPYKNYCVAVGRTPETISHWHAIPAISTDAFKMADYPLTVTSHSDSTKIFLTSGTTGDVQGRHFFASLDLYEASILEMWAQLTLPKPSKIAILTPRPEDAPHSSLSHMMGVLAKYYTEAEIIWAIQVDGSMDYERLTPLTQSAKPIAILGTAIAFLHLFEKMSLPLPPGSFAMETGGYKGTRRQLEKAELYALFEQKLAIPESSIINEYSMTELSSQFYTRGLSSSHSGPSWARARVIDPRTGSDAATGQPGYVTIYDLANLHSVMALQTQDIAIAGENGSFTLLGRDPTALPRGCSRAADHTLS